MLFGKARKMVVASDKPAALAEKVLSHPSFCINEFGFMGNLRSDGQTILMVACKYGRIACVRMLVAEYGADVNAIGGLGHYTPLCYAAYHGHLDVVRLLLENGADSYVVVGGITCMRIGSVVHTPSGLCTRAHCVRVPLFTRELPTSTYAYACFAPVQVGTHCRRGDGGGGGAAQWKQGGGGSYSHVGHRGAAAGGTQEPKQAQAQR